MRRRLCLPLALALLFGASQAIADSTPAVAATAVAPTAETPAASASANAEARSLDDDVQNLKKQVLDLNRDLFVLREDLLFPANTEVAVFVSIDVGTFFELDSVKLSVDGTEVAGYLYTPREAKALLQGGVQRLYVGNLKVGQHELIAIFTGKGPHTRDYRSGTTIKVDKGLGAKFVELKISDLQKKLQPEFLVRVWE